MGLAETFLSPLVLLFPLVGRSFLPTFFGESVESYFNLFFISIIFMYE